MRLLDRTWVTQAVLAGVSLDGQRLLTEHEQQIGEDRADQGVGNEVVQLLGDGDDAQNELHHIAKGSIQQAACAPMMHFTILLYFLQRICKVTISKG